MTDAVQIALIVAGSGLITGVIGPIAIVAANGRQRRKEKREDHARQDVVAAKVFRTTSETASAVKQVKQTLVETTEATAIALEKISGTGDKIHVLVNGNMGAALRATAHFSRALAISLARWAKTTNLPEDEELAAQAELQATEAEAKVAEHKAKQVVDSAPESK